MRVTYSPLGNDINILRVVIKFDLRDTESDVADLSGTGYDPVTSCCDYKDYLLIQ